MFHSQFLPFFDRINSNDNHCTDTRNPSYTLTNIYKHGIWVRTHVELFTVRNA